MPRTDVPPPGQGKRSKKRAWRENADQAIAIYGLTAEEAPEIEAIEDLEAMSHALPYWDDMPQVQSRSQIYSEEEVQEMVERAYREGWQEGVEEGYKLGKDKANKEYKDNKVLEEEEGHRNAENQANKDTSTYKDTQYTPTPSRTNPSTISDIPIVTTVEINDNTVPGGTICSISGTTATRNPWTSPTVTRTPTSSRTATPSSPESPNVEIAEIYQQAVPGGTKCSASVTTVTSNPKTLPEASRSPTSSFSTTCGSPNSQIVEIAHIATYNTTTSSNNIQDVYLDAGNTPDNVRIPYVVHSNSQNTPRSNRSDQEKNCPLSTHIPEISEHNHSNVQNVGNTPSLVDVDTQEPTPASGTSTIAEKNPPATDHISETSPRLSPLPGFQLLNPTPYKRASATLEMSNTLTEPNSNPALPEKPMTTHQFSQFHNPGTTSTDAPVAASQHIIPSLTAPSFIIHAQTVIVNNYPSANSSTGENGTTIFGTTNPTPPKNRARNSKDEHRAPAHSSIPAMPLPPRDLSALRSNFCHRPFSSLRRRSNQRQSASARGPNWNNHHPSNWSRNFQSMRWIPPICQSF